MNTHDTMLVERYASISRSLVRSTTADAAIARLNSNETTGIKPNWRVKLAMTLLFAVTGFWLVTLFWRLVDGPRRTSAEHLATWLEGKDLARYELWEYDSGSECGYALLDEGEVVDFWLHYDYQATEYDR